MLWYLYKYVKRVGNQTVCKSFNCIPINIEDYILFATVWICKSTNPYEAIMFELKDIPKDCN